MTSTPAQFARFRIINETRHCLAEGCNKFRKRTSRFCNTHTRTNTFWGHPLAKHIPTPTLDLYRFMFDQFVGRHADTEQVKLALELCTRLIQEGLPQDLPKWRVKQMYWTRGDVDHRLEDLKALDVTGREVLVAAGGAWLLARREPRLLQDDMRLTYRLGAEIFKTRQFPVRLTSHGNLKPHPPGTMPRRSVGKYIRRHLGVFFERVCQGIDAEQQHAIDQDATLSSEFNVTTATPTPPLERTPTP